jgi:hypothetical protein
MPAALEAVMNRETRPNPATDTPVGDTLTREDDVEHTDTAAPIDADWPEREAIGKGAPPPDDGDNDASSYGQPIDPDQAQDEGVAESLGKAVSAPVRDAVEGTIKQP